MKEIVKEFGRNQQFERQFFKQWQRLRKLKRNFLNEIERKENWNKVEGKLTGIFESKLKENFDRKLKEFFKENWLNFCEKINNFC